MLLRLVLLAGAALPAAAAGPAPLIDYVTYLGGSRADSVVGMAVDSSGSAYVAGNTSSPDFPVTSTTLGNPATATGCAFVTKFHPSGASIEFSICLAGTQASAFALDAAGNIYLALNSPQQWFNSYQLVKLDPTGRTVLYTALIGVPVEAIAVDSSGALFAVGSAGPGLATTAGAFQTRFTGGTCPGAHATATQPCTNGFVLKLTPAGTLAWATYFGGAGPDRAHAVALDAAGNVWIAGETASPDLPVTANAISKSLHGAIDLGPLRYGDGFVAKLDPSGRNLFFSTYLGGAGVDGVLSLAVDSGGAAYAAGGTQSADFPVTPGALHQTAPPPNPLPSLYGSGFVTKFDTAGNVVYSATLGTTGSQLANPVRVDSDRQAYVSLVQNADSYNLQPTCAGDFSPAVSVLNAAGSAVIASSPIPGAYLALDGNGGLYTAGLAHTLVFFSTPGSYQTGYGGGDSDAFAAKVDLTQQAAPSIASVLNAGSYFPGYATQFPAGDVAPGEIVAIFGNGFGSKPSVGFDGLTAPVLYASNCQINAVVPFGLGQRLGQRQTTSVTVQSGDQTIGPVKLPVVAAAPGIFTANASGSGQAAVLNQDSSVNSPANPASRGSYISVFLTGTGMLDQPLPDGSLGPVAPPFPKLVAPVGATVAGFRPLPCFRVRLPG